MRKLLYAIVFVGLFISCNSNQQTNNAQTTIKGDDAFKSLSDSFISGYLKWRPEIAIAQGIHDYDGKSSDLFKPSLDAELNRLKQYDEKLSAFDTASLSAKMFYDFRILHNAIKNELFDFEDLHTYTKNPIDYAYAADVSIYIKRDFAPLEQRLQYLIAVEKNLPNAFSIAEQNLQDTLAKPLVQTAMDVAGGYTSFMKKDLLISLKDVKNDLLMATFKKVNDSAIAVVNNYVQWLKTRKFWLRDWNN